jgi:hypothetical protein
MPIICKLMRILLILVAMLNYTVLKRIIYSDFVSNTKFERAMDLYTCSEFETITIVLSKEVFENLNL